MIDNGSIISILDAMLDDGADRAEGPSGPVLDRLSELATEGDLTAFAELFTTYGRAKPPAAAFVQAKLPAMLRERYLLRQPGITSARIRNFESTEPGWAEKLREAAWNPGYFPLFVAELVRRLQVAV